MLCQNCGENEANTRYTQIINGEKKEMFLCEECSHKLGINNMNLNMPIDFASFLGGILEDYDNDFIRIGAGEKEEKCEYCNMTYDEFIENGKIGCANCYKIFQPKIDSILKRLDGNTEYLGRKSKAHKMKETQIKKETNKHDIEKLQMKLKQAIQEERYEEAAKIRDEIKNMNERGEKDA